MTSKINVIFNFLEILTLISEFLKQAIFSLSEKIGTGIYNNKATLNNDLIQGFV